MARLADVAAVAGVPIKRVDGYNFRTHVALVLQEDRILSILPEVDPVHQFERLLQMLDVAEGRDPGVYELTDRPWYEQRRWDAVTADEEGASGIGDEE